MKAADYSRRLAQVETSLGEFVSKQWTHDELIEAMLSGGASPLQMSQVFAAAEEDVRTNLIIQAAVARERREQGTARNAYPVFPVGRAIELISYPPVESPPRLDAYVPPYEPAVWTLLPRNKPAPTFAPFEFVWWARQFLMTRLLGEDGGMTLRRQLDDWFAGGPAPIDPHRYPDPSVYWLLEPVDTNVAVIDPRLLRRPTEELFWRIGTYDRFDSPEKGHKWS